MPKTDIPKTDMPRSEEFFLYLTQSAPLVPTAEPTARGIVVGGEEDPNEARAMEVVRAAGHEAIYDQSFLVAKLGELLRFARKQQGLTQLEAAEHGELSQAHISRLENGLAIHGPTFESLVAYLNGIGFDVELAVRLKETGEEFARLGSRSPGRKELHRGFLHGVRERFGRKTGRVRYRADPDDESER